MLFLILKMGYMILPITINVFQGLLFRLLDIQRKKLLIALLQMVIQKYGNIRFGCKAVGTIWEI